MKTYVLLTGGSSGIGKSIAKDLCATHNIIFLTRNVAKTQAFLDSLSHKKDHQILECDLKNLENIEALISKIDFKIESFIHSAGVSYMSYAKNFDEAQMRECGNINLYSAMAIIKYLLRKPLKQYLKNIVFISSAFSQKGAIANSFYASTKGGLDSYMKSLALELAPDIQVNSILPGGIFDTGMTKNLFSQEQKELILKSYPLGEGKCEDIAMGVRFLLESRWITGQQLSIDGGFGV